MKSRLGRLGLVLALIGAVGLVAWLGQSIGARVGSALDQMAGAVAPGPAAAPVVASSSGQATDDEEFVMSKEVCGYDFPFDEDSPRARAAEREIETQAMLGLRRAAERLSAETDPRQRTLGLVMAREFELIELRQRARKEDQTAPCQSNDTQCDLERQRRHDVPLAAALEMHREKMQAHARASRDPMAWAQVSATCRGKCGAWLVEWSQIHPGSGKAWLGQVDPKGDPAATDALLRAAARATDYGGYTALAAQLALIPEVASLPPAAWDMAYFELALSLGINQPLSLWLINVTTACKKAVPGSSRAEACAALGARLVEGGDDLLTVRLGEAVLAMGRPPAPGAPRLRHSQELMDDYGLAGSELARFGASCEGIARRRVQAQIAAAGGELAVARAMAPLGREIRARQAREAARDAQRNPFAPGSAGAAPPAPRN